MKRHWLVVSAFALVVNVRAAEVSMITPVRLGAAISARLGGLGPDAAAQLDSQSLIGALNADMSAAEGSEERREAVASSLAVMQVMAEPARFAELEATLSSTEEGRRAAAALKPWVEKAEKDVAVQKDFAARAQALSEASRTLASMDASRAAAAFDGSAKPADSSPEGVPEMYSPSGYPSDLVPALQPAPEARLAKAQPRQGLAFGTPVVEPPTLAVAKPRARDPRVIAYVEALMRLDPEDVRQRQQGRGAARTWGSKEEEAAAAETALLESPFAKVYRRSQNDDGIAQAIAKMKTEMSALDPREADLKPVWWRERLHFLGVKQPVQQYVATYESAGKAISEVIDSLKRGRDELLQDNDGLLEIQTRMRKQVKELKEQVLFAKEMDAELETRIKTDEGLSDERREFLKDEVLFPLRRRIMDLQTQLIVNQQGIAATGLIIKNNEILAEGVASAIKIAPSAMLVNLVVKFGLGKQKSVASGVKAANQANADMMEQNAEQLSAQASEVQRQAAEGTLPLDTLKSAFGKLEATLEQVDSFRGKALEEMKPKIEEFHKLAERGQKVVDDVDGMSNGQGPK